MPDRFIGLFRPTKPLTKLIQNLTQSHEIRFGDALEEIFTMYFGLLGFKNLPKRLVNTISGDPLSVDQLFEAGETIYLIEQKVRDDHDSTKKRGQFINFENKFFEVARTYNPKTVTPIMWYVDDSLAKNKNFYSAEIAKMNKSYGCQARLCYGRGLFLDGIPALDDGLWNEVIAHLAQWKKQLPDMPEINFDNDCHEVFSELKDMQPSVFRQLFSHDEIREQILPILFPIGVTLRMLIDHWRERQEFPIYKSLIGDMEAFLEQQHS